MNGRLTLPSLGDPVDELWETLLELADRLRVDWTIVGGLMVLLHALEHQTYPPVVTQDADVIANIRTSQSALRQVVDELTTMNFDLAGMSPEGIAHRYVRVGRSPGSTVVVDVLAPDGVGAHADLTTTKPGRTIEVPGGTQALKRTEHVEVQFGDRVSRLPRPSLLGAIVGKSAACGLPQDVSRHFRDLAFLCSLVDDPFVLRKELSQKDRKRLRLASALDDGNHNAWRQVNDDRRSDGVEAWKILNSQRYSSEPLSEWPSGICPNPSIDYLPRVGITIALTSAPTFVAHGVKATLTRAGAVP